MTEGSAVPLSPAAADQLVAYVDESSRTAGDEGVYLLAATLCSIGAAAEVRMQLRALLLKGQPRLHWKDESDDHRAAISEVIAGLGLKSVVVIGAPVDHRKPERARRICIETLHPRLEGLGVTSIIQERRTSRLNRRDLDMIEALRGQRLLGRGVRVDFAEPVGEPMLWVPDAVAGAVGMAREGRGSYFATIAHTLDEVDIVVR